MSKRVCNKRGRQRVPPSRSTIHLGYQKRRRLDALNTAYDRAGGDYVTMQNIRAAMSTILPARFFRRGIR